ncbi:unnamed protein product [Bursaphelenchus okinawaensis]|uniref:Uncharacterized protein n=1 Tax=Bursaphelenchus okinawaensis TaxID=465554 RepID=A0A811KDY2_9BILA|nr:unnamed protein product [Bursaphelenchus okinawaensis]CAG9101933.1 unnamed protein product [Bursaphelenchus okinawaensis]
MESTGTKIYSPVQSAELPLRPQFEMLQMETDDPYDPSATLTIPNRTHITKQQPTLATKIAVCVVAAMMSALCIFMLFSE